MLLSHDEFMYITRRRIDVQYIYTIHLNALKLNTFVGCTISLQTKHPSGIQITCLGVMGYLHNIAVIYLVYLMKQSHVNVLDSKCYGYLY